MDAEEPLLPEHFAGDVGGVMGAHLTGAGVWHSRGSAGIRGLLLGRSASAGFLLALDSRPSP